MPRETDGGALGPGSSLDLAVTTAVALAAAHLQAGDRVGTVDLTVPAAAVRPGRRSAAPAPAADRAGRDHRDRDPHRAPRPGTADRRDRAGPPGRRPRAGGARPAPLRRAEPPRRLLAQVPARALAVVLSPFLDDRTSDLALVLQSHGRTTVAVDCLPTGLVPDRGSAVGARGARAWSCSSASDAWTGCAPPGWPCCPPGDDLGPATRALVRARERARR